MVCCSLYLKVWVEAEQEGFTSAIVVLLTLNGSVENAPNT